MEPKQYGKYWDGQRWVSCASKEEADMRRAAGQRFYGEGTKAKRKAPSEKPKPEAPRAKGTEPPGLATSAKDPQAQAQAHAPASASGQPKK